jgi:hypothetical protein
MEDLMIKWLDLKRVEQAMKAQREDLEAQIYMEVKDMLPEDGSKTLDFGTHKLTVKHNFTVKIDQEKAKDRSDLFKWKAEMSYSQFKKCEDGAINDIVSISMTKPTFTVVGV